MIERLLVVDLAVCVREFGPAKPGRRPLMGLVGRIVCCYLFTCEQHPISHDSDSL